MAKSNKKTPREQITEDIIEHLDFIQSTVDGLATTSASVQHQLHEILWEQVQRFEIKDKRFIPRQDLRRRMIIIEEKFEKILTGKTYADAVQNYLSSFSTIEKTNIALQKDYNELQVDLQLTTPARRQVYKQAKAALYGSGIDAGFREPLNHMLLMQVTTGGSISDMEEILQRWNAGDLSAGSRSPTGRPMPNLQQYATQLARDTSYQFNGTVNEIIAQEFGLDGIMYVGDIIRDSRPLCVHLVNLRRDVGKDELAELLVRKDLLPGRIPGTTVQNFCTNRGGFACRHMSFPVRIRKASSK
ncbi:hypothetical protein [Chitinophaga sp. YIM B06452]|uniref:hypothetical protein n=1 Tax=Chitinophaga sp. YIM B06452 TaxID=3082158 RepID=UPI0031FED14C